MTSIEGSCVDVKYAYATAAAVRVREVLSRCIRPLVVGAIVLKVSLSFFGRFWYALDHVGHVCCRARLLFGGEVL